MVEFSDSERKWHADMRSLTTDERGREVLVGLTVDETEFYVASIRTRPSDEHASGDGRRFLELRQKHERARLQVLAAESQLRIENPPRQ